MSSRKRKREKPSGGSARSREGKPAPGRDRQDRTHPTGWRLWLFRGAAAILLPGLLLLVLEASLRIGGYGFPATATIPCEVNGVACRGDNVRFGWRFFPRGIAQEFDPFVFPVTKPARTCRIFVLGGSAAQGTPDPAYSFGRILEAMLDHAHPDRHFEVTVAAMPAINSHVVVEVARDLARYGPDLFVLYLGNNEVVGPYGPGTVLSPLSPSRPLIRAGIRLRSTRTGQLFADLVSRLGADSDAPKVWRGLEMFTDRRVSSDDPRLDTVRSHFRRNLEAIARIAADSGAEVVLCTVGSNLRDSPPFASQHRSGLSEAEAATWAGLYREAVRRERDGDDSGAVEGYLAAAEIDDRYADLQFRLGRCFQRTGDHEKAKERFALAREFDALRFRPDRAINEIIREAAAVGNDGRIHLVDAEQAFEAASPSGVPGRELFHEHVHLTFRGNYLLARGVCEQTGRMLGAGEDCPMLDEATCAERLAYNPWAHYNTLFKVLNYYIRKPPFAGQLSHDEQVRQLEQELRQAEAVLTPEVRQRIAAQYRDLISRSPADIWLRLRFAEFASVQLGEETIAVEQCRRVAELVPHSYKPHLLLALSLGRLNRFDEARVHLHRAVRIKPTCEQAHYLLGLGSQAQGRLDEAMTHYARAVRLRPDNVDACKRMHDILASQGRYGEARRWLERATTPDPPKPEGRAVPIPEAEK